MRTAAQIRVVAALGIWIMVQETPTEFEVASIKPFVPATPGPGARKATGKRGGPGTNDPGQITWGGASLKALIMTAYDLKNYQVSGPDWLDTQRFEVVAKVPAGATRDQVLIMWQNLLAQRFLLKTHHETRSIPIYELMVAKGGPKMKESPPPPPETPGATPPDPNGPPVQPSFGPNGCPVFPGGRTGTTIMMGPNKYQLCASELKMENLVTLLTNQLGRPVFDKTGLTGKYEFKLEFLPDNAGTVATAPPADPAGFPPGALEVAPPIPAALQSQLGLRLEAKKAPAEILVIDSMEKSPTAN